jgi:hypothetical protein
MQSAHLPRLTSPPLVSRDGLNATELFSRTTTLAAVLIAGVRMVWRATARTALGKSALVEA